MAEFNLTIAIKDEETLSGVDVANALRWVALKLDVVEIKPNYSEGVIRNDNGKSVGMWELTR